jgi:hypothetical protein
MGWATMWKFVPEALKPNRFSANRNIAIVDGIQRSVAKGAREELRSEISLNSISPWTSANAQIIFNRASSTASPVKRKEEQRFAGLHKPWLYLRIGKYLAFIENLERY